MSLTTNNTKDSTKNISSDSAVTEIHENSFTEGSRESISVSDNGTSKNASQKNQRGSKSSKKSKEQKKARGYCFTPASSSHTHFYMREKPVELATYKRVTRKEFLGYEESMSGSSDTFGCDHPDGKQYTEAGLLKRNLVKNLDPIEIPHEWLENCPPTLDWGMSEKLVFLMGDDLGMKQVDRMADHLRQFVLTAADGFTVEVLDHVCIILDFLVERYQKNPGLRQGLELMLKLVEKPIILSKTSDIVTYLESMENYIGFLGYLLLRVEEDSHFDLVSRGLLRQLSAGRSRQPQMVGSNLLLAASGHLLLQTCSRMLALASSYRFPAYLQLALILAFDSEDNCIEMIKENILENILCRFNPYFPHKNLPVHEIIVFNPNDIHVRIGDSAKNLYTSMSLLLVLLKTAISFLKKEPKQRLLLPCPNEDALRCFIWAFRYECRANDHHHQRNTMVAITMLLLDIFTEKLILFNTSLMPDVLTLAVSTELPPRNDWTAKVNFNTTQIDAQFKKLLIQLSVYLLKIFPYNSFMLEHRLWFVGLMYLLDPGLSKLRAPWNSMLFAEIQRTALQALIIAVPYLPYRVVHDASLIRRLMWYIEWYTHNPYEIFILYWCLRLLQTSLYTRHTSDRTAAIKDLYDTHGIIMIIELANTLLAQKQPPVEKSQVVIGLCLRIFTSSVTPKRNLACTVYPNTKWPNFLLPLGKTLLQLVLSYLIKHYIIGDRFLIQVLNFIWEGIIWNDKFRTSFMKSGGVYQLLDLITLTDRSIQCLALALVCDLARTGEVVAQLVTWRASVAASDKHPTLVKRGATIGSLLAAVFREDLALTNVALDEQGVIRDVKQGIMPSDMWKHIRTLDFFDNRNQKTMVCFAAGDLCGSRMSKAYALLQLLSDDLAHLMLIADESYNLYKNVILSLEDEVVLVLVSHYLTLKLGESWEEICFQNPTLLPRDEDILAEFLEIKEGWIAEIKRLQMDVIKQRSEKDMAEEYSLYSFLGRVRLNTALDALRAVKCAARSADRDRMAHLLLHDAVRAYHRRSIITKTLTDSIIKTYEPMLDEQNVTGQYVTIRNIVQTSPIKPPVASRLNM